MIVVAGGQYPYFELAYPGGTVVGTDKEQEEIDKVKLAIDEARLIGTDRLRSLPVEETVFPGKRATK